MEKQQNIKSQQKEINNKTDPEILEEMNEKMDEFKRANDELRQRVEKIDGFIASPFEKSHTPLHQTE
jgi:hypothetical protein